jgi:hypothetical protein
MKYNITTTSKTSKTSKTFLLVLIVLIVLIIVITLWFKLYKNSNEGFNDYFDCYLKLTDINPHYVKTYMKFDNQHVANGYCTNATLHVSVNPCPTDNNGAPLSSCNQTATLTSSKGNPLEFPLDITPSNVSKFFGIKTTNIT